ncbi:MAG: toxin HicA [Firmicutes bacterium]|nr:toxin HicA [Bacillota bacterium]
MSKLQKLYRKIKNNPKAVSFRDLDKLLAFAGFKVRQPGGGSSHYFYKKKNKCISVPYKRPYVREYYVNRVIELLEGELDFENQEGH